MCRQSTAVVVSLIPVSMMTEVSGYRSRTASSSPMPSSSGIRMSEIDERRLPDALEDAERLAAACRPRSR